MVQNATKIAAKAKLEALSNISIPSEVVRPLLRWAGGKQALLSEILSRFESPAPGAKYVEPFLGAASVFLAAGPERALLGDLNYHLVEFYQQLSANPDRVSIELAKLSSKSVTAEQYYRVREEYNRSRPSARQAARFLFLNKTCFNGVFRVNRAGEFNVPFGHRADPALPTPDNIREVARLIADSDIGCRGFEETLERVKRGDSVFIDPPYPPSSATAYFAHYTTSRFSEFDQHRLAAIVRELDSGGVKVMVTNANCKLIRRLYSPFQQDAVSVTRWISCKAEKPKASELIIKNY